MCNKEFLTKPAHLKTGRGKWCSKQCYYKSLKGKPRSLAVRKRISEVTRGKNNPFYGKHHTLEARKKMGTRLENHPKWKGGGFKKCIFCGKSYKCYITPQKYCSKDCYTKSANGRIINYHGYIMIKSRNHPFAPKSKYICEHRLIVESILGRYLKPIEVIHHIDENRKNNHPSNLYLFPNDGKHMNYHQNVKKYPYLKITKSNL